MRKRYQVRNVEEQEKWQKTCLKSKLFDKLPFAHNFNNQINYKLTTIS